MCCSAVMRSRSSRIAPAIDDSPKISDFSALISLLRPDPPQRLLTLQPVGSGVSFSNRAKAALVEARSAHVFWKDSCARTMSAAEGARCCLPLNCSTASQAAWSAAEPERTAMKRDADHGCTRHKAVKDPGAAAGV